MRTPLVQTKFFLCRWYGLVPGAEPYFKALNEIMFDEAEVPDSERARVFTRMFLEQPPDGWEMERKEGVVRFSKDNREIEMTYLTSDTWSLTLTIYDDRPGWGPEDKDEKPGPIPEEPPVQLEPLEHVGPPAPGSPTFRRWVDEKGNPVVLNPWDGFPGEDSESHYAAPSYWKEEKNK